MAEKVVIGSAELWHGDCREILPTLPQFDLVLTDPPYGISADKGAAVGGTDASGRYVRRPKQYEGGWDAERPTAEEFAAILGSAKAAVIWGGNYFSDLLPQGGRWMFWDKLNSMPSYSDGEIAWTSLGGVVVKKFTQCNNGLASLRDGERCHPTQKPVNLIEWCLSFAPNALTVCDPYMGSGTTLIAAIRTGRRAIGIEIDERHFRTAVERVKRELAQPMLPAMAPQRVEQQDLIA